MLKRNIHRTKRTRKKVFEVTIMSFQRLHFFCETRDETVLAGMRTCKKIYTPFPSTYFHLQSNNHTPKKLYQINTIKQYELECW